jgi:hypothetical protein
MTTDPNTPTLGRPLTETERTMLRYALDQAQEQMLCVGDEFSEDDHDAIDSLRRLADGPAPAGLGVSATPSHTDQAAELERLRTENERMRHELEVMYGGAFDSLDTPPPADRAPVYREAADRLAAKYSDDDPAVEDLRQWADEAQQQPAAVQPAEPGTECAHCGNPIRRITGTLTAWWVHRSGGQSACHPERPAVSPRATPRRVKHAGPDTEFCVLCLSGEHERVTDAAPQPGPSVHGESVAALAGYQPDGRDTWDGDEQRCTCADAGTAFAPAGHYADCPQAEPAVDARQDGAQQ